MTTAEDQGIDNNRKSSSSSGPEDAAWVLVGGGVVGAVVNLLRGHRRFTDWLIPAGLTGAGLAVLLKQRRTHIDQAEEHIRAELDTLDPVAKAQVLKSVVEQELNIKQ